MLSWAMSFAIMRSKKLSSMGSCAASLQHCFRERDTPNADAERTHENEHRDATSVDQAMGKLREALPDKRRKDAVLAVEYVMTASPDWWTRATPDQQREFFDRAEGWLAEKYGRQNIITSTIHRDETTPHLSAFVVPITADGRLSAKEFIGNRDKMNRDQTTFADRMKSLGLERGIERSKAKHKTIQQHYTDLNKKTALYVPQIGHEDLEPRQYKPRSMVERIKPAFETQQQVLDRVNEDIAKQYARTAAWATKAEHQERQNRELQRQNVQLQKDHMRLSETIKSIASGTREQALALVDQMRNVWQERQAAKELKERERSQERDRGR